MAWFSRFTRFGDMHLVYGQELSNSCAIASIIMCVFKVNKLKPDASSLKATQDIIKMYEAEEGAKHNFEVKGGDPKLMARVLNKLHCGTWVGDWVSASEVSRIVHKKIGVTNGFGPTVDVNPVMAGVGWTGGGGHATVIDTIREFGGQLYATVCDPWDANVHITDFDPKQPFKYRPGQGGFSVNFWGQTKGDDQPFSASTSGSGIAIVYRT
ncbi:MAG: hypothetical protein GY947_02500 [Rhodobacteraceae bacterium]|nr:hypothetical protein [Paracoccaceae bacterium]